MITFTPLRLVFLIFTAAITAAALLSWLTPNQEALVNAQTAVLNACAASSQVDAVDITREGSITRGSTTVHVTEEIRFNQGDIDWRTFDGTACLEARSSSKVTNLIHEKKMNPAYGVNGRYKRIFRCLPRSQLQHQAQTSAPGIKAGTVPHQVETRPMSAD